MSMMSDLKNSIHSHIYPLIQPSPYIPQSHFNPRTHPNNGTSLYILSHPLASHPIPSPARPTIPSPPTNHSPTPAIEIPITIHLTFLDLLLHSNDPKNPPLGPLLFPTPSPVSISSLLYPIHHAHPPTTCQTPTPTNAPYHTPITHGALAIPCATNPSPTPELPPSTYTGTTLLTSTCDASSGSSRYPNRAWTLGRFQFPEARISWRWARVSAP